MTIPVEILGREMKVDAPLEDYVSKKASRLDRYMDGVEEARVDLSFRKATRSAEDRFKAQITLLGKGFVLRAEERAPQVHAAFDTALDKIQRQMERFKGKRSRGKETGAMLNEQEMAEIEAVYREEPTPKIDRRKKFLLQPMNAQEAIEQMNLLGHEEFFVFYNMEAGCVSVLYKRGDDSYGLIDTELA